MKLFDSKFGIRLSFSIFVIMLCIQAFFCHAAVTAEAEKTRLGRPTYPLPFYNNRKIGICFFNALLQCLLQSPKFCEFIDNMNEPKNELEIQLKTLRKNLKMFNCDESLLFDYLQNPKLAKSDKRIHKVQADIRNCSDGPCLQMYKCVEREFCTKYKTDNFGQNLILIAYMFLNTLFDVEFSFCEKLKLLQERAGICYMINISKLDLVLVLPLDAKNEEIFIDVNKNFYCDMVSCFEKNLQPSAADKEYKLMAVNFFVPCSLRPYKGQGMNQSSSDEYGHSAAYVKHGDTWFFCDDFYRKKWHKPMIKELSNDHAEVFSDMVECESGALGILFFRATNSHICEKIK